MKAAERAERNAAALKLFLAGNSYREIGLVHSVSTSQAERIVKQELASTAQRRTLITDEALAIHQERFERLFALQWERAEAGDQRAAETCERMLARNARMYGLAEEINPAPLPAPTVTGTPGGGDDDEGPQDDLARIRRARDAG